MDVEPFLKKMATHPLTGNWELEHTDDKFDAWMKYVGYGMAKRAMVGMSSTSMSLDVNEKRLKLKVKNTFYNSDDRFKLDGSKVKTARGSVKSFTKKNDHSVIGSIEKNGKTWTETLSAKDVNSSRPTLKRTFRWMEGDEKKKSVLTFRKV